MNSNIITNLPPLNFPHEVATKSYVVSCPRKISNGYVLTLRSLRNVSILKTGFVATVTSQADRAFVPMNVFNGFYARVNSSCSEWATAGETGNFYLQIQCPEFVSVWKVALGGGRVHTNVQGSTDGENVAVIFAAPNPTYLANTVQYF